MPPEQIEGNITYHLERFFTLASGIDHMESRSLAGVSLIKVYFQPGVNPDSAVTTIASLAMAEISHLPPGTLPPFVLKLDASSLPVCLVTLKGQGLSETQLKDLAQNVLRNQLAGVSGASVPQPFGGRWRQMMLYVDPHKLESHAMSPMDVVRSINESNVILPAGDVQIGRFDYGIYANSQVTNLKDLNNVPVKLEGQSPVRISDIGEVKDAYSLQYNVVRVDGQRSVYLPVLKQGGGANTIQVVDGVRQKLGKLFDVPESLAEPRGFRSVAVRQDRDQHALARSRYGDGPDLPDDPHFSGQHAGYGGRVLFHSAVGAGYADCAQAGRQLAEQHGPRRSRAGVLAPDRQLGGRFGEHSPPSRTRRAAVSGRGKGRPGSRPAGARGDAHYDRRVFPGDAAIWRQQVSVLSSGAWPSCSPWPRPMLSP